MGGCRRDGIGVTRRNVVKEKRDEEWMARKGLLDVVREGEANQTDTYDDMLRICWGKQECWSCLGTKSEEGDVGCSWCPSSQTCIPNPTHPPFFAPFVNSDICPLWYERWELRTTPLGCHVSTITVMAVVVAVLSTMLVLGAVGGVVVCVRKWNADEESRGWWKVWRWRVELRDVEPRRGRSRVRTNGGVVQGEEEEGERRPLLDGD
ncbi:uncharacterized protein LY89DRAFT_310089 [Mollisia scopiformis]|uniref:PSI domain-containing protein n=1 Tax=Mollisia scopiformis TaxID=149040 RepID=A0A194XRE3_MOLSC|nr:uncharacterized protein LY89DRAFT_310089 [Mollisia scopiformis]KUJ22763.1 hypothetical protein LY89DRAFT_310089 [Mollisia scopiformis]